MGKNYLVLAFLAAKNIFAKSPTTYRLIAAFSIFALPLIIGHFAIDDLWTLQGLKDNWIAIIGPLLGISFLFWFPEFLICVDNKKVPILGFKLRELFYLCLSVLLFIWFLFFLDYVPARHTIDPFPLLFWAIVIGFIISGISLTKAARKRKPIFWILMVATLMAVSYMAIFYLAGFCHSPPNVPVSGYGIHNPIERIGKYCF
jgi:hypothetical protein